MPKALRLLHSTPATRTPAAIAVADPPSMPDGLDAIEAAAWTGLLAELSTVPGLLARADRGVIELVARLEPAMRAAAVVVRDRGTTMECFDKNGDLKFAQTRGEAAFLLKAIGLLRGLYAELGLTPSGRCRVSLSPAPAASRLDQFLGAKRGA